jgi:hypothetical protein
MTEEEQRYLDTFTGGIKPIHIPDNYVFDPSKGGYVSSENAVNADPVVSSFVESNIGPATTLTPLQQLAQDLQGKIEDVGFDTYKKRDGEYNVRFADGTSQYDQDLLDQYGVSKKDFLGALRGYGNYIGSVGNRLSAGSGFEQGLENILNPEQAQQDFQARLEYNRREDKEQEQRDATRKMLDDQVAKETEALGLSSTDAYYNLPFSMRLQMAGSDIAELFGESNTMDYGDYGGYEDIEDPVMPKSGLGVLSDENRKYYADLAALQDAANYAPSLDTMDAMYYADAGGSYFDPAGDAMYMGEADPDVSKTSDFEIFGDTGKDIYSIGGVTITSGGDGTDGSGAGSNNDDRKGTFSKKRDVYGNPIRLTKGGQVGGKWQRTG